MNFKKAKDYKNNQKIQIKKEWNDKQINIFNNNILQDDGRFISLGHKYVLWGHDIYDKNWGVNSYKKLYTISNVSEFWRLFNNFNKLGLRFMHYYLMKDGIFPIWEDPSNYNGGMCSIKIELDEAIKKGEDDLSIWTDLNIKFVCDLLITNNGGVDEINGISISPKNNWAIIKIWNKNGSNDLTKTLSSDILEKYKGYSMRYKVNNENSDFDTESNLLNKKINKNPSKYENHKSKFNKHKYKYKKYKNKGSYHNKN